MVETFKFLGIHLSSELTWSAHVDHCVAKAQQRLFFLRRLRSFGLAPRVLSDFYRSVVESVLTYSIAVRYGSATEAEKKRLQRVANTASKIIGEQFVSSVQQIYTARLRTRAQAIAGDASHPGNKYFELLPSGRRYGSVGTRSTRAFKGFFPCAVRELNNFLSSSNVCCF